MGYVHPDFAARLAAASGAITLTDKVTLAPRAAESLNELAVTAGCRLRAENFDVRERIEGPVLALLDRGALPDFGVIGVGVHVNGLVRRADGLHLWIGKRAHDKKLDPSKLDNLVGGGVAAGHTPFDTVVKEAAEEANLPESLAATATEVARFGYNMEREEGLRRDFLHVYDLYLPEDFIPQPADGEVERFMLWPLHHVFNLVRDTNDFKFNVNLVLIDLFLRHNLFSPEDSIQLRQALG